MVKVGKKVVEFRFFRPEAESVSVVGDFNNWQAEDLPMVRTEEGHWRAEVDLPPGTFKFKYVADGQWYTDFAAFGVEPSEHGWDSVLHVPDAERRLAA